MRNPVPNACRCNKLIFPYYLPMLIVGRHTIEQPKEGMFISGLVVLPMLLA
jgi:hypothetical protein